MITKLELKIVSLQKILFHDYVDSVSLPTTTGEITVLPNHAPLTSILKSGEIRTKSGEKIEKFQIEGGFIEVTPDSKLSVLVQ